jgi:hypothetical protein
MPGSLASRPISFSISGPPISGRWSVVANQTIGSCGRVASTSDCSTTGH